MKTKMIWANLAIKDKARTTKFYTDLGFKPNGLNNDPELASFLVGEDEFVMHFFLEDRFKSGLMGEISDTKKGNEILFSLSAKSKDEVDQWGEIVKKAGATIFMEPGPFQKGYMCVFADPDGHKFNVLYWPGM
jgi:predicted lactoylglutathione lyase